MRKFLLLILSCIASYSFAQSPLPYEDHCKQVKEIALMERMAHERLANGANLTFASNNFQIKYYRCEWEVDPSVYYITGKVTAYFMVTAATNSISFDLMNSLNVDSVKQRGVLLTKSQASNLLTINFAASMSAGTLDSVSIFYKGPPANTGFGSFVQSTHAGQPIIWTLSEPYGARDWWPCRNGNDDKIDSIDIILTYPSAYTGASNGILQSETLIAGGTKKTAWWKHRYPVATYLVCFAVTNFSVFNNSVQLGSVNLPMQTYCYPESLASFQNGTQTVLNCIQLYHNNFGPYPFINEKYGHVQFGWGGGMEHQTATFVTSIDENLCAHELGHQWFGDKVTCGSWADIWLNEGFATYLADFFWENKYPTHPAFYQRRLNEINYVTSAPGGSVYVDDTTSVNRIFNDRLSYYKGCRVLYMLRLKLGDSAFFNGLRNYQKDPKLAYGFARTADLRQHLEATSGQNLTQFFNDWIYGQGYPSYTVEWSTMGSEYVRIKMKQTTSDNSVQFFALPVPLKFKNATQEKTIVVDNKTNFEVFINKIGFVPDTVLIDPQYWLITKNNTTTKVPDPTASGIHVFPNPVTEPFFVSFNQVNSPDATIGLYNSLGQRIYANKVALINGSQYVEVPSKHLPAGIYTIRVIAGSTKFTKQLIKR